MITCISRYYPRSYPEFLIYLGNIGFYLFNYELFFNFPPPCPPPLPFFVSQVPNVFCNMFPIAPDFIPYPLP